MKKKPKRQTLREKIKQLLKEHDARMEVTDFPEDGHVSACTFVDGIRSLIEKK